jgi:DNA-binding LacI/PurR family transcriptional regulator
MKGSLAHTKHFQISQSLVERVKYLAPGDPLPTVAELMSEFQASQVTITQALERLRKHGLVERPFGRKRLLVANVSDRTIYRIVFIRPSWPSPDFDCLVYAIQEAAIKRQWGIDIFCYTAIENLNIARAMESNDAAIFVPGAHALPEQLKKAICNSEKPIIFMRERPTHSGSRSVSLDDYSVGKIATKHLLQLGHRQIVPVMSEPATWHSSRRLAGWRDAMAKCNVPNISSLMADCSVQPGSDAMAGAYEKFSAWLKKPGRPKFSALFCLDWTGAMAAMRALREAKISVPEKVSLITFSGEEKLMAFLNPPLTTVEVNVAEFAAKAIKQVEEALSLEGEQESADQLIKPFLVERESTRPYRVGQAHV